MKIAVSFSPAVLLGLAASTSLMVSARVCFPAAPQTGMSAASTSADWGLDGWNRLTYWV
ncbi:hypothetical protein [Rhodococcus sp. WS7]|uniref:hypothetical protein n=1 Tax=Rhodococcus sp. WS7 TaxID=2495445 RepID=UPI0015E8D1C8|nr:hypothetical protein [Rhodococcus sp. WS7]